MSKLNENIRILLAESRLVSASESITFKPPANVAKEAAKGLELRKQFKRGGTEIGVARARDLSNRKSLPLKTILRMCSYFARHEVDKKGKDWNNKENPSAGKIAALLWGGEPGKKWAESIKRKHFGE
jgi:hypothetical protein